MKRFFLLLIFILSLGYPFLVYTFAGRIGPAFFGLLFLVLGTSRFLLSFRSGDRASVVFLLFFGAYCMLVIFSDNEFWLRLYPVAVSGGMAALFAQSLTTEASWIEQMARRTGRTLSERARRYTRQLTRIWVVILVLNALVALYLALFGSLKAWTLYCGLLSYLFMAAFFLLELAYRQYYIRRYGE